MQSTALYLEDKQKEEAAGVCPLLCNSNKFRIGVFVVVFFLIYICKHFIAIKCICFYITPPLLLFSF